MRKWWEGLPSHIRAFLSAVGVTLVLGVVIVVGAAIAPKGPSGDELAQQYVEQASDALSSGDTDKAQDYVNKALENDPDNQSALILKTEITKMLASKNNNSGGSQSGDDPADEEPDGQNTGGDSTDAGSLKKKYASKRDVSSIFPTSYSGWRMATVVAEANASTLSATPLELSSISTLQWAAVDQGSESGATGFVNTAKDSMYPDNASTMQVSGIDAVVGTKSSGQLVWASVTFSIGRYSFQVLATGKPDVDINKLIEVTKSATSAFKL